MFHFDVELVSKIHNIIVNEEMSLWIIICLYVSVCVCERGGGGGVIWVTKSLDYDKFHRYDE